MARSENADLRPVSLSRKGSDEGESCLMMPHEGGEWRPNDRVCEGCCSPIGMTDSLEVESRGNDTHCKHCLLNGGGGVNKTTTTPSSPGTAHEETKQCTHSLTFQAISTGRKLHPSVRNDPRSLIWTAHSRRIKSRALYKATRTSWTARVIHRSVELARRRPRRAIVATLVVLVVLLGRTVVPGLVVLQLWIVRNWAVAIVAVAHLLTGMLESEAGRHFGGCWLCGRVLLAAV